MTAASPARKRDFSFIEGIAYLLSAVGIQLVTTPFFLFAQSFYTPAEGSNNTVYIPLTLSTFFLIFARIMDAVSDPVVGYWSDRTRSKLGRRRPWIIYASIPACISFIMLWTPPVQGESIVNFIYALVTSIIMWWSITMVLIPLLALLPEVGGSSAGRVKFGVYWGLGLTIGFVIGALCGMVKSALGTQAMGLIFGASGFACFQFAGWVIKERFDISLPVKDKRGPFAIKEIFAIPGETLVWFLSLLPGIKGAFKRENLFSAMFSPFVSAFKIKAFRIFVITETIFNMAILVIEIILADYNQIILGKQDDFTTVLFLPFIAVCFLFSFAIPLVSQKLGKKQLYLVGLGGFALVFFLFSAVGSFSKTKYYQGCPKDGVCYTESGEGFVSLADGERFELAKIHENPDGSLPLGEHESVRPCPGKEGCLKVDNEGAGELPNGTKIESSQLTVFGNGMAAVTSSFIVMLVLGIMCIAGIPNSIKYVLPYTMIGDMVDVDQQETGQRREAIFSGALGFAMKTGQTLSYLLRYVVYIAFGGYSVYNKAPILAIGPITAIIVLSAGYIFIKHYPDFDKKGN